MKKLLLFLLILSGCSNHKKVETLPSMLERNCDSINSDTDCTQLDGYWYECKTYPERRDCNHKI